MLCPKQARFHVINIKRRIFKYKTQVNSFPSIHGFNGVLIVAQTNNTTFYC